MAKIYGNTTTTPMNPTKFSAAGTLNAKISNGVLVLEQVGHTYKAAIENNILVITKEVNL